MALFNKVKAPTAEAPVPVTSADSNVNETDIAEGTAENGRKNGETDAVTVVTDPSTEGSRAKPAIPSMRYPGAE